AAAACVAGAVMVVSPASQQRAFLAASPPRSSTDAIDRILAALLTTASPSRGGTSRTTVLEAMARAEQQILAETDAPPSTRYNALEQIMDLQNDYGDYAAAADTAQQAATIADMDPTAPPLHAARLRARSAVLRAHCDDRAAARAAVAASIAELSAAASRIVNAAVAPADPIERRVHVNYAQAHVYLALAAKLNGDLAKAHELSDIAMPFHRTGVFAVTPSAVTYLINRAKLEQSLGNLDVAVALAAEAVAASKVAEADNEVEQLSTRAVQATVLEAAGQLSEAATVYRESLEAWTRIGGDTHPKVITALNNLGLNLSRQGKHADAIQLLEDACRRAIVRHGEKHQYTIDNHGNLALAYDGAGRTDDAAAVLERYLPVIREAQGSPSIDECVWLHFLAELRVKQERLADARALLEQVISTCQDLPELKGNVKDARALLQKLQEQAGP
ncbi:MAG: tetratricopeptide repeat protein, partial [Phycisphaerales bacterium]|nr:tetratricopeptide repeat protein [Phycisphaerales bacterium]